MGAPGVAAVSEDIDAAGSPGVGAPGVTDGSPGVAVVSDDKHAAGLPGVGPPGVIDGSPGVVPFDVGESDMLQRWKRKGFEKQKLHASFRVMPCVSVCYIGTLGERYYIRWGIYDGVKRCDSVLLLFDVQCLLGTAFMPLWAIIFVVYNPSTIHEVCAKGEERWSSFVSTTDIGDL